MFWSFSAVPSAKWVSGCHRSTFQRIRQRIEVISSSHCQFYYFIQVLVLKSWLFSGSGAWSWSGFRLREPNCIHSKATWEIVGCSTSGSGAAQTEKQRLGVTMTNLASKRKKRKYFSDKSCIDNNQQESLHSGKKIIFFVSYSNFQFYVNSDFGHVMYWKKCFEK